jgi:hypothetical protein
VSQVQFQRAEFALSPTIKSFYIIFRFLVQTIGTRGTHMANNFHCFTSFNSLIMISYNAFIRLAAQFIVRLPLIHV